MRIGGLVLSLVLALHAYMPESRADMASLSLSDYPDFAARGALRPIQGTSFATPLHK